MEALSSEAVVAFLQVVAIDLVLAGDNAVIIALAAAGLAPEQRGKAILIGIAAATLLRIAFAAVAVQLLSVVGLLLPGGLLLLWVCWKMWRELRAQRGHGATSNDGVHGVSAVAGGQKTLAQAATQIVVADIAMSLDNVLAVAGAAREHPTVLVFGLALSVVLMGVAATLIANLLQKHRWIAFIGLAIILYVALEMVWKGGHELAPYMNDFIAAR